MQLREQKRKTVHVVETASVFRSRAWDNKVLAPENCIERSEKNWWHMQMLKRQTRNRLLFQFQYKIIDY